MRGPCQRLAPHGAVVDPPGQFRQVCAERLDSLSRLVPHAAPAAAVAAACVNPHEYWPSGQDSRVFPLGQGSCACQLAWSAGTLIAPGGRPFGRGPVLEPARLLLPAVPRTCIGSFGKLPCSLPGRVHPRPDSGASAVAHVARRVGVGVVFMPAGGTPEHRLALAVVAVCVSAGVARDARLRGGDRLDAGSPLCASPRAPGLLLCCWWGGRQPGGYR